MKYKSPEEETTAIFLFRTESGAFVVEVTLGDHDDGKRIARVCNDEADVRRFLGQTPIAKRLYHESGINNWLDLDACDAGAVVAFNIEPSLQTVDIRIRAGAVYADRYESVFTEAEKLGFLRSSEFVLSLREAADFKGYLTEKQFAALSRMVGVDGTIPSTK